MAAIFTFEVDGNAAGFQFNTLQGLAQGFVVVTDGFFRTATEGQREIQVCFLAIVVRTDSVCPQHNFFIIFILILYIYGIELSLEMKCSNVSIEMKADGARSRNVNNLNELTKCVCSSPPTRVKTINSDKQAGKLIVLFIFTNYQLLFLYFQ